MRYFLLGFLIFITACTPEPIADTPTQTFNIYATSATEGWLAPVYECAAQRPGMILSRSLNNASADISLRLIAPNNSEALFYQIGEVELVVGLNSANPVTNLSEFDVIDIFTGKINNWSQVGGNNAEIILWVYEQVNELQVAFNETLLGDRALSSLARQASNEKVIRQEISADVGALGILTASQNSNEIRILHSVGKYPVLMIAESKPGGPLFSLVACLQGK